MQKTQNLYKPLEEKKAPITPCPSFSMLFFVKVNRWVPHAPQVKASLRHAWKRQSRLTVSSSRWGCYWGTNRSHQRCSTNTCVYICISGQITMIPTPELRG